MAQHHGMLDLDRPESPVMIIVKIGTADATGLHRDQHILAPHLRHLGLFDPKIMGPMTNNRLHFHSPAQSEFTCFMSLWA